MSRFESRRAELLKAVAKQGLDALLVTDEKNVTYLTGFTGDSSYLLVAREQELLISDARYSTQLEEECPGLKLDIRPPSTTLASATGEALKSAKLGSIGVEKASLTLAAFDSLQESLNEEAKNVELVGTTSLVENLRQIKDEDEIAATRRAVSLAEKAFAVIRKSLQSEMTERQVAADIEHQIRIFGGRGCSFPPIVAVGSNAALPHAQPGSRTIGESGLVLIDWGADEGLYKSDLTRVLVTGKIPPKLERVYGVVLTAQLQAISQIRPGVTCEQVDWAAREVIENAGFGSYFGHSLGHGVGLNIHEAPRLGPKQETQLKPGMIVTVEPGIYLPGQLGVRIEDDVLVTPEGCEVLTNVPKQFEEMFVD